jgi:RimJ/RimL family protein N-acetyltransferase
MQVRSLGYQTDLIFASYDGEVINRGNYLVVRTPTNPSFYWGNYLLFEHPPMEGDYQKWQELFVKEIGTPPLVTHQVFGWDTTNNDMGAIQPFLENGYHIEQSVVLTTRQLALPLNSILGVTVRPFELEYDWTQSIENQVECREPEFAEPSYRLFRQRQMNRYRAMAQAGLGAWFGAFIGNQLVADLGIFHSNQLGRYQSVITHPKYRRKGIARQLVLESGIYAFNHFGLANLVIVADVDSIAERLYHSIGFEFVEHQIGVGKWNESA